MKKEDEDFIRDNFLDSKGNVSSAKLKSRRMTDDIKNLILEETKNLDEHFPDISLANRIKYILFEEKTESFFCSCGKPLSIRTGNSGSMFAKSCGDQTHIILDAETRKERNRLISEKAVKRRNDHSLKTYTLEEQKEYILARISSNVAPNYFFSEKKSDINLFIKERAKELDYKQLTQYAYDVLYGFEEKICEHCGKNEKSFLSFEKGYTTSCNDCCRNELAGLAKKSNTIEKLVSIFHSKGLDQYYEIIDTPSINEDNWTFKHLECGKEFQRSMKNGRGVDLFLSTDRSLRMCTHCHPSSKSSMEYELIEEISKVYSGEIIHSATFFLQESKDKRFKKEIDVYFPEKKLGVEMNGVYWHSVSPLSGSSSVEKNKHREKREYFEKNEGITLIQFTDLDWIYKKDIVISMVLNKLGLNKRRIGARETYVDDSLSSAEYKMFLERNHIKGYAAASIKIGLRHKNTNELLSVFGISKRSRFSSSSSSSDNLELVRFCSSLGTLVIGGLSKGIRYLKRENIVKGGQMIESYADLHYGDGKGYESAGFTLVKKTTPGYWYYDGKTESLISRFKFQKHKLPIKNMSENEYTESIGLRKYYDCGNLKYTFA